MWLWTSRFTRLQSGKIQSAEIQELAMMAEAAQIACLGQNGQSVRWPDVRHGHESPAIGIIPQHDGRLFGDMLAEPMQIQILSKDEAEHRYGGAVERHWYSDRPRGGGVNLREQSPLAHFAADRFQASVWNSLSLKAVIEAGVGKLASSCTSQTLWSERMKRSISGR
jgi:hypothetical protein